MNYLIYGEFFFMDYLCSYFLTRKGRWESPSCHENNGLCVSSICCSRLCCLRTCYDHDRVTPTKVVSYDHGTTFRVVTDDHVTTTKVVTDDHVTTTKVVTDDHVTTSRVVSYDKLRPTTSRVVSFDRAGLRPPGIDTSISLRISGLSTSLSWIMSRSIRLGCKLLFLVTVPIYSNQ